MMEVSSNKQMQDNKNSSLSLLEVFTKDNTEVFLNTIKIVFYLAIISGVIWNLAYYGFVVGVLPDFDAANLISYLVSVLGVGIFFIDIFVSLFILPGLIVNSAAKEQRLKKWLEKTPSKYYYTYNKISNGLMLFILPAIYIFIMDILIMLSPKSASSESQTIFIFILAPMLIVGLYLWLNESPQKFIPLLSIFLFLFLSQIFIIVTLSGAESSTSICYMTLWVLLTLSFAVLLNGKVAVKGLDVFFKTTENPLFNAIGSFLMIAIIIILFFSNVFRDKPNPFLIAPYKILRIGQVDANLTLDEDFVKKTPFIEKYYSSEQCQTTFKFKILSSIGTEYIVEYLDSKPSSIKNYTDKPETTKYRILRIPKDKVLLVKYV